MAERVGQRRAYLGFVLTILLAAWTSVVVPAVGPTALGPRSVSAAPATSAYQPVGPLRLADTRLADCGCTRVNGSTIEIDITAHPDLPNDALAAAITITATPTAAPGYVTVYPAGAARPVVSTLNTRGDRAVANTAIVSLSSGGRIALFRLAPGDLIVDITGVFVPVDTSTSGRFVPVTARRLVDTRQPGPDAGPLGRKGDLTVALPSGVDADATALVVNVTSVDDPTVGYLSARPAGKRATTTSFLNTSGLGQAVASATIVPVSADGFTIRSLSGGHVIVDLLGWFTGASAPSSDSGLFVPLAPGRIFDSREQAGRVFEGGTVELASPIAGASSVVTNVTATLPDRRGFVSAYAAGTAKPGTSTLNPAFHDHTLANLAITRTSDRGLAYWSLAGTDLVVDVTGYFTGSPTKATRATPPNTPTRSRVLIVGDSTLAGLEVYSQSKSALIGFDAIVDAAPCRRLLRPSCHSNTTGQTPNTAYEAILTTPGDLDIVVIKTGYNDWFSDFPLEFDAIVQASRAKGAHTILWLSYNEQVNRPTARRAYQENNADLYRLVALPQYGDVVLADWLAYSGSRQDWFADGTHLRPSGAWALSDYISRWISRLEHRPCARPWVLFTQIPSPCPVPELVGPVPNPISLY